MKLLMAISADGFIAAGPNDDMTWLGPHDKKIFRILTSVNGVCCVGRITAEIMPQLLGRKVFTLSRKDNTLQGFYFLEPDAWLLGGQTLALEAFYLDIIDEIHLCRSSTAIGNGILEQLTPNMKNFQLIMHTTLGDTRHEVYRK